MGTSNMFFTEIVSNIQNNFCTQHVLPMFCKKKSFWQRFTCKHSEFLFNSKFYERVGFIFLQKFSLKVIGTLKQNFTVEFPEFANLMQHPFVISPERKVPGQQSDKNKQKKKNSIV